MGAEDIIKDLCEKEEIYDFIASKIKKVEKTAIDMKVDLRGTQPSVGNIEGGLTTIEEKSLGGICKIGSNKIVDAVEFGSKATKSGVTFVDTPATILPVHWGSAPQEHSLSYSLPAEEHLWLCRRTCY